MMTFLEQYEFVFTVLTPVHIGCGQDYEPTNYVIKDNVLYHFDTIQLAKILTEKEHEELAKIVDRKDALLEIQRYISKLSDKIIALPECHKVNVHSETSSLYQKRLGKVAQTQGAGHKAHNVVNNLEIERTAYASGTGLPVLYGSSIKGSIRTALSNYYHKKININQLTNREFERKNAELQQTYFGKFSTDLMRFLKIGDARYQSAQLKPDEKATCVKFQVNHKKHPSKFESKAGLSVLIECIQPKVKAFRSRVVLEKPAALYQEVPQQKLTTVLPPKEKLLTMETLVKACNDFYCPLLEKELDILETQKLAIGYVPNQGMARWTIDFMRKLLLEHTGPFGQLIQKNEGFLLRIGKHSGAEAITIEGARHIKIMKGKNNPPEYKDKATTIWLAASQPKASAELEPFGWVFVQVIKK